jgi:hypothetical protein
MIEIFKKLLSKKTLVFVFIAIVIFILYRILFKDIKEDYVAPYWNYPTRYYPSYDIRGYPRTYLDYLFPWLFTPYGFKYGSPFFRSPYYYGAGGSYLYDPAYSKMLTNVRNKYVKQK